MNTPTRDLIGDPLDWAVGICEKFTPGIVFGRGAVHADGLWEKPCSTGGSQGYVLPREWKRLHRECEGPPFTSFTKVWSPSTNWAQGGPIIEREQIWLKFPMGDVGEVEALHGKFFFPNILSMRGPTPLIAAMRCFIASKLGDEVDVPKELT